MIEPTIIESRIREGIADVTHLVVEDLTGGRDHFQALVVSSAFAGMTRIEQHQLVYRALGELMGGAVHALSLTTFTPDAWSKRGKSLV